MSEPSDRKSFIDMIWCNLFDMDFAIDGWRMWRTRRMGVQRWREAAQDRGDWYSAANTWLGNRRNLMMIYPKLQ
ncbi:unnamed protein product [Nezara viridula]|uniref:Uncharacterized protein n=1 Tax=Nezara viridula TaxID=85310 RepID=A0A9P0MIQ5_NEZVI|nr:unnamed protein product [Nezara viridula]